MANPRKPSHLKVVAGTYRPDRAAPNEPKPRRERPSPPAHISDRAKAAWAEAVLIADRMGVLTEADTVALEFLASAVADFRAAHASLARPLVLKTDPDGTERVVAEAGERYYWTCGKGGPMRRARPELTDIADADRRVATWIARFGLSPADRARVSATPETATNPFDAI